MTITFGTPLSQGSGDAPSIAVNDQSLVVSVHVEMGTVVYRVGRVDKSRRTLSLGPSMTLAAGGTNPTIAINNNNLAVCVFERSDKHIYSVAGEVFANPGTIDFGPETRYDTGRRPGVAVRDDGTALEVHMSESGAGVYCHTGPFDHSSKTIKWGGSSKFDTGQVPKVALNGTVACSVHRSETSKYDLYYNVGDVGNRSHSFADGVQYYDTREGGGSDDSMPSPSIALTNSQIAIGFQDVGEGDSQLSYFLGRVDGDKIGWPKAPTFIEQFGLAPSVAANNQGVAVVTYTRGGTLTYLAGTF